MPPPRLAKPNNMYIVGLGHVGQTFLDREIGEVRGCDLSRKTFSAHNAEKDRPKARRTAPFLPRGRVKSLFLKDFQLFGAVEKTRTSTGFRPQRPQRCASTSSATTALGFVGADSAGPAVGAGP